MQQTVLIVEDAETCASILEIIFSSIRGLNVVTARTPSAPGSCSVKRPNTFAPS